MSIQNREPFLDQLAKNLGRPRRTERVKRPSWSVQPQWNIFKDYSADELVDELEKQCKVIHTDFKRTDTTHLANVLQETIDYYDGKSVVIANDKRNEEYGLGQFYDQLEADGMDVHIWDPALGKENQVIAERADVGITFSDITLAESGTVTLFNNRGNGRTISLLPKTYIAIIPKSTLVARLSQATKSIHEANEKGQPVASCVSFVTGPSNSADIEMNLIVGVHGPIKATYIVVD